MFKVTMFKTLSLALLTITMTAAMALSQTADVQIIHNSPDPAAAEVDIYVNSELALDDFAFRAATPVLELPAEVELVIGVAPGTSAGPEDIIANFPVTLPSGGRFVVMAAGVLDPMLPTNPEGVDTSFNLYINQLETMAPAGEVGLLAFHGAPDAPTVDILAVGVGPLFTSLQFNDFQGYLNVPENNYTLNITPAGMPNVIVASFAANLTGLGGAAAVVFASGFLTTPLALEAFGLYAALPDGSVVQLPPTSVPTQNASWGSVKNLYND